MTTKKTIKNSSLINISNTLQEFSGKKLPQKISYAITKNILIVSKEYEAYEKQLHTLFDRYDDHMEKDEEGNRKTDNLGIPIVDKSVEDEFREQILDLLNIQIECEFYTIPEEVFDYEDKGIYDPLSARDIIKLQSILLFEEEENDEKSENGENEEKSE